MPVTPRWKDEQKTIIVIAYQSPWNWDEFDQAALATNELMDTVKHDVVLIHDTSHGGMVPPGNVVGHGRSAIANFPANLALIIVVFNSTLIRTFLSLVVSTNPGGRGSITKTSPTLEKAYLMADEAIFKHQT